MESKIVFVILNFEMYWETIQCVESIYYTMGNQSIGEKKNNIIIVDNGSKNESSMILQKRYSACDGIHIILNERNLGFAKGNNVGFQYAKQHMNPDFIIFLNSDIIMTDNLFHEKLDRYYKKYHFAVAGPNVVLRNGKKLNPSISSMTSIKEAQKVIKKYKRWILLCKMKLELPCLIVMNLVSNFTSRFRKKSNFCMDEPLSQCPGAQLHGCFLIFSRDYINVFDGIYDKTFLYGEEALLRMRCQRANLSVYVLEDISALHNESQTEKYINRNIIKRHLRRYRNMRDSCIIVKEYMENERII